MDVDEDKPELDDEHEDLDGPDGTGDAEDDLDEVALAVKQANNLPEGFVEWEAVSGVMTLFLLCLTICVFRFVSRCTVGERFQNNLQNLVIWMKRLCTRCSTVKLVLLSSRF